MNEENKNQQHNENLSSENKARPRASRAPIMTPSAKPHTEAEHESCGKSAEPSAKIVEKPLARTARMSNYPFELPSDDQTNDPFEISSDDDTFVVTRDSDPVVTPKRNKKPETVVSAPDKDVPDPFELMIEEAEKQKVKAKAANKAEPAPKERKPKKRSRAGKIALRVLLCFVTFLLLLLLAAYTVFAIGFNGPSPTARKKLAKSLIETSAMKWVPGLFLPQDELDEIMKSYEVEFYDDTKDNEKTSSVSGTTVTIDVGPSITLKFDSEKASDYDMFTVKSVELDEAAFTEGTKAATLPLLLVDKSPAQASNIILSHLKDGGYIPESPKNENESVDSVDILLCTICPDSETSAKINATFTNTLKELSLSATVHGVFVTEIEADLQSQANERNITYGKAYFAKMVADESITLSSISLMDMSIKDILANALDDGLDVSAIVDFHNDEQSSKSDEKKKQEESEWAAYPDGIRIETIVGKTYTAHLMIIRDPSRIFVATSYETFDPTVYGKRIVDVMKAEGAIAGINGGYFLDNYPFTDPKTGIHYSAAEMKHGQIPVGIVVSKGKDVFAGSSSDKSHYYEDFGFVGIDYNNKLVLSKDKFSLSDAKKHNIRDGVCGGPILILDGVAADYKNASGQAGSLNPRTVIGQRDDGAIILLCVDGRMANSLGASYADLVDIMIEYGAYNAACLDGGSSTIMYYKDTLGRYGEKNEYVRVNTYNAIQKNPRKLPTYFMIAEQK